MDELLRKSRTIVCSGSGGVGKTTLSAAIGVRAAQIGLNVLVLTVDPAKRLATALGLKELDDQNHLVPDQNYPGKLYAALVNPKIVFDRFITANAPNPEVLSRLKNNSLYKKLTTTLNGSQEFTSLEMLCEAVGSKKYDVVILDTPPAGHALEFLDATKKLEHFLQDSVLRWFLQPFEKQNTFAQMFNQGTKLVLKAFEKVVGSDFLNELVDFLGCVYQYRIALLGRFKFMRELLESQGTHFVLVTGFDEDKLVEAKEIKNELMGRNLRLSHVVVNRTFPTWFQNKTALANSGDSEQVGKLAEFYESLKDYYSYIEAAFDRFQKEAQGQSEFLRIVDFDQEIYNLKSLERVSQELVKVSGGQQ